MSLDLLKACVEGYQERMTDQQILGVHTGFWAGYYSKAKKPKPIKTIVNKILNSKKSEHVDDAPDVDAFLAQEQMFQERLAMQTKI